MTIVQYTNQDSTTAIPFHNHYPSIQAEPLQLNLSQPLQSVKWIIPFSLKWRTGHPLYSSAHVAQRCGTKFHNHILINQKARKHARPLLLVASMDNYNVLRWHSIILVSKPMAWVKGLKAKCVAGRTKSRITQCQDKVIHSRPYASKDMSLSEITEVKATVCE